MCKLKKIQNKELENAAGGSCSDSDSKPTKKTVWYVACKKCKHQLSNNYNTYAEAKFSMDHAKTHHKSHGLIIKSKEVDNK